MLQFAKYEAGTYSTFKCHGAIRLYLKRIIGNQGLVQMLLLLNSRSLCKRRSCPFVRISCSCDTFASLGETSASNVLDLFVTLHSGWLPKGIQ